MPEPSHMTTRALSTRPANLVLSAALRCITKPRPPGVLRMRHAHAIPRLRARLTNFCLLNAQLFHAIYGASRHIELAAETNCSTYPPRLLSENDSIRDGLQ
jgi:hypothetical protein